MRDHFKYSTTNETAWAVFFLCGEGRQAFAFQEGVGLGKRVGEAIQDEDERCFFPAVEVVGLARHVEDVPEVVAGQTQGDTDGGIGAQAEESPLFQAVVVIRGQHGVLREDAYCPSPAVHDRQKRFVGAFVEIVVHIQLGLEQVGLCIHSSEEGSLEESPENIPGGMETAGPQVHHPLGDAALHRYGT